MDVVGVLSSLFSTILYFWQKRSVKNKIQLKTGDFEGTMKEMSLIPNSVGFFSTKENIIGELN